MTTSIQEIYESNKVRQYTQADAEQLAEARKELVSARLDLDGAGYQKNRDLIDEFFQKNRNLQVTVANIYKAVEQRKSEFVWFSPAQFEYNKVAAENPTATQKLVDWLAASQGKPGTLVNDGNAAYENLTMLLIELRGRPVDSQRIHEAIGRISFKPGRQLHYLPEPRKQDPRSHAATDDGTGFLGGKTVNEPLWKRLQREREAAEAKDAASRPSAASAQSAAAVEAQRQAESIQSGTHAETDQLKKLFVTVGTEIDWQATLASRLQMQKQFDKQREVRRFIR